MPVRSRKPDFFIVGAPKCGTTAMAQYLAEHPEIYMARKEMHFFGADLRFGPRFYRRDAEAYLAEYRCCNGQRRAGEASVWYLFSAQAATEIRAFNPEASVIIMLRDPVEMLYAIYYQFCFDANEHMPTFEEALAAEDERRAGRQITRRTFFLQGLAYRQIARYTEQVRRYFTAFGRERVHVIIYDDFAGDAAKAYSQTLDFLGVNPQIKRDFKVINGNKSVRSRLLQYVLSDPLVRSAAVALGCELPLPVFAALAKVEERLWRLNSRVAKRLPLAVETDRRLRREFAPEVERLSQLLNRDLTHWSR